jgi:hypothetical protein
MTPLRAARGPGRELEVVEEVVRREEVEIDDQTGRDTGSNSDSKLDTEDDR